MFLAIEALSREDGSRYVTVKRVTSKVHYLNQAYDFARETGGLLNGYATGSTRSGALHDLRHR